MAQQLMMQHHPMLGQMFMQQQEQMMRGDAISLPSMDHTPITGPQGVTMDPSSIQSQVQPHTNTPISPVPGMMAAPPETDDAPEAARRFVYVRPKAGDLLMWESWLRHEVMPGRTEDARISVSFNFGLKR